MSEKRIPKSIKARLPIYLHYLKSLPGGEKSTISSAAIAKALGLGDVQVRKDLALVSGAGRPKIGYSISELSGHLEEALGSNSVTNAIIIGAGKLGKALLCYDGFDEFGLDILAAFDSDESKVGVIHEDKRVYPVSEAKNFCAANDIKIGVITVPERAAEQALALLIECGVSAVWNFAPVRLKTPSGIKIKNENMAASLAVLSADIDA